MYKYDIEVENMRTISILGSTGSIGTQTLEVVEVLGDIQVGAISGNHNIKLLEEQAKKFRPRLVCCGQCGSASYFRSHFRRKKHRIGK